MTTPALMTAAEMRAHLIEKRRELDAQRAAIAAEQATKEAARLKVWAPVQLAKMLDTLKQGSTDEASTSAGDRVEMQSIVDLARSLGYAATVELHDDEDSFYAVVKAPELDVASEKPRAEPGDDDWLNGATGRVRQ